MDSETGGATMRQNIGSVKLLFAFLSFSLLPRETFQQQEVSSCTISSQETCNLAGLTSLTKIYPGGNTRCYDNTFPNPFFFQVLPGRGDDANKLHVHFQGGGACLSNSSCLDSNAALRSPSVMRSGIFNHTNELNPYQNWTAVGILYCSGDVHIGNASDDLTEWRGRENTLAVLNWLFANVESPSRLLLTGCSAGSMGLQFWSKAILDHYASVVRKSVVFDAYIGMNDALLREFAPVGWNSCSQDYGWTEDQYNLCLQQNFSNHDAQLYTQKLYRDTPFGFLSYKNDPLQRLGVCPVIGCTQKKFYHDLQKFLLDYTLLNDPNNNNALTYWFNGIGHCALANQAYFTRKSGRNQPTEIEWMKLFATWEVGDTIPSVCSREFTPRVSVDYGCNGDLNKAVFVGK